MCHILLVDMNAFYASVHQALEPSLRGKPVIVCGDPERRHGIVLAASYEAKKYGVKTTMPKWEAQQLVPNAVFLRPDHRKYADFSERIMDILRDFSPLVEVCSIDEAFIDVSGCKLFGNSVDIAKKIKIRLWQEIGVLCSVGIGSNKLIAKMAAELEKPDGLTVIKQEDIPKKLWPLPIRELYGVGSKTEKKLRSLGIRTIGQLAGYPAESLERRFGSAGRVLHLSANGVNNSPVNPHSHEKPKSIGNQLTLCRDYVGEEIKAAIIDLAEKVGFRLRKGGFTYKTITLTLRDTKFVNHSWSMTLQDPTDITEEIFNSAIRLLTNNWPAERKVRLVGVTVSKLMENNFEQTVLFTEKDHIRELNRACDDIKKRFGYKSIARGVSLTKGSS